jgi:hypothetical protein
MVSVHAVLCNYAFLHSRANAKKVRHSAAGNPGKLRAVLPGLDSPSA